MDQNKTNAQDAQVVSTSEQKEPMKQTLTSVALNCVVNEKGQIETYQLYYEPKIISFQQSIATMLFILKQEGNDSDKILEEIKQIYTMFIQNSQNQPSEKQEETTEE